jgi:hypothetical protein
VYRGGSKVGWRRPRDEELHDMYFWPDILFIFSSRMRWAGHIAHVGDRRVACRELVERPEERRPLGIEKRRLEGKTKMDL